MEIRSIDLVRHPIELVFATFRDQMPAIAEHIPNVRRIEVLEREDLDGGQVRLVNHWFAVGEVPALVRSFIKPEMLAWKDTALWDGEARTVRWELEPFFFREQIRCGGTNRFVETEDGATEVHVMGQISIDGSQLGAVPKLLRARAAHEVEKLLVSLIGPNLGNAARGVQRYLDARAAETPATDRSAGAPKAPRRPAAKKAAAKATTAKATATSTKGGDGAATKRRSTKR